MRSTLPFVASFLIQFLVIRISNKHAFCVDNVLNDKPQRFHVLSVSRAGGLGVYVVSLITLSYLGKDGFFIALSALPVFLVGFYEDLKTNISPKLRLLIIASSAVAGMIIFNSIINDLDLFRLPLILAIPFTIFAITGVTNSINIIDGLNGLASGVSIIALLFFALVSYVHGDQLILNISVILIATITGFIVWNYPKGKVFLGDGGAYLIGFFLAIISILLVKRNPGISPWFPLMILSYPIFDTIFSIYRRKIKKGTSAFEADRVHLHSLIYKRITKSNPKTSFYIWLLVIVFNVVAFSFHSNTPAQIVIFLVFSATYISLYRRIVRFKA